ncbi:hypothetical protein [Sulfitobacter geojensis]|uniref:hypothetical protein n=1 Tax=Sulfitobacter geojensis TaxID=1342299 RepID=UPI0036DDABDE
MGKIIHDRNDGPHKPVHREPVYKKPVHKKPVQRQPVSPAARYDQPKPRPLPGIV